MSILDQLNQLQLEVGNEPKSIDFNAMHNKALIDLEIAYERPPLVISIGRDEKEYNGIHYPLRFGTAGNISMIKGEEKARKSFLKFSHLYIYQILVFLI